MRILLVVPQDQEIGGVASVVGNLARYLASQGHQVLFFHPNAAILIKRKTTKLGFPGFELRLQMPFGERHPAISILAFAFLFPILMCQLIWLIHRHRIQIINVHYPKDFYVYFALCRRLLRVALVTSIHGAEVFPDGKPQSRYSRTLRPVLSASDWIVAPSKRFQQDFVSVFPQFGAKSTVIHNGINLAEFDGLSTKTHSGCQVPYVLCISAYKEQKAIDVLIRAFKWVHEADPTIKLIIVGPGHLRRDLEELASSLGIHEWIECLGPQGRAEVLRLLHGCEVFVLPSRFETFGIVVLEAMAFKKPVIATAVGGIPEIIEDGTNGILVPPDHPEALGEALVTVLNNRNLQLAIAANGYATVHDRFGSERNGTAYQALFAGLLGSTITKAG